MKARGGGRGEVPRAFHVTRAEARVPVFGG